MRTLKGLLLQMKIDASNEMRILAEEEIVIMFEQLENKLAKALEIIDFAESQLAEAHNDGNAVQDIQRKLEAINE